MKKKACAGHFPNPKSGTMESLMKKSILEFGDLRGIEAYITGSSPGGDLNNLSSPYVQKTIEDRAFVLSKLKEYGINESDIHFKWTPDSSFTARLKFDTNSGKNNYTFYQGNKIISKGIIKEVQN